MPYPPCPTLDLLGILHSGKDLVIKARNIDGQTAFQYSYKNDKHLAMEMMIKNPKYLKETSKQVGWIFQEACFRGNSQVVEILLKHENSRYII